MPRNIAHQNAQNTLQNILNHSLNSTDPLVKTQETFFNRRLNQDVKPHTCKGGSRHSRKLATSYIHTHKRGSIKQSTGDMDASEVRENKSWVVWTKTSQEVIPSKSIATMTNKISSKGNITIPLIEKWLDK